MVGEAQESSQQQISLQKPAVTSPNTNPSSQQAPSPPTTTTSPASTPDDTVDASETDDDIDNAPLKMASWQEYRGPHFTAKASLGFMVEADAYAQDEASKEQFQMLPAQRLRDFRFVFGGGFPILQRKVTYKVGVMGVMYDAPTHFWLMRQTGIMVAVPKLWGNIVIGRSKEGFSLIR
jgi:hypothetical protein